MLVGYLKCGIIRPVFGDITDCIGGDECGSLSIN
jgi:hypothetical protein